MWLFLFIIAVLHVHAAGAQTCQTSPPEIEIEAAIDLYESTLGSIWTHKWPVTTPVQNNNPCDNWYGVDCALTNNSCHIVGLSLQNNSLVGSLPESIGSLTYLKDLYVSDNLVSGSIPWSIGDLVNLVTFDAYNDCMTGRIPASIGNLSQLHILRFLDNMLTGRIPDSICQLHQLTNLEFSDNRLTGSIPTCIGDALMLEVIQLNGNKLTGRFPSSIGNLVNLETLDLSFNSLTGKIPTSIGNLTKLVGFGANDNHLSGNIPDGIGNLVHLTMFEVYNNRLEGQIPSSISNLKEILDLHLQGNLLSGELPASLGQMTNLFFLALNTNQFTGDIPSSFSDLSFLRIFELYQNFLVGPLPSPSQWGVLQYFDAANNLLSGRIPSSIDGAKELYQLHLEGNRLTGSIPSSLTTLQKVYDVFLYDNYLTGSIPNSIGEMSSLTFLYLQSNQLNGTIPASIGNLHLALLYLHNNRLSGTIPDSVGKLVNLETFYASNNRLVGSIPSTICDHRNLRYLYLEHNFLTGMIPSTIAKCHFLRDLGLGSNHLELNASTVFPSSLEYLDICVSGLTGPLPESLLQLSLEYLDVSFNLLTGTLPSVLWGTSVMQLMLNDNFFHGRFPAPEEEDLLCSMKYVSLSNNWLTGELPPELSKCSELSNFAAGNMLLSGPISGLFNTQQGLTELVLATNLLTGSVEDVMESAQHGNLILNAAYNALTGPLPKSLDAGLYQSLILTDNCLTGHLPMESLCANTNMTELLLSGLHSASACRSRAFDKSSGLGLYSSYFESLSVGGTVSSCLFELTQLKYLALSGNYLTGSLPQTLTVQASLQELDLSHNALEGRLPEALVQANFKLLDLSFNRLSGTIASTATDHYASNAASEVSLRVNRLSGTLPARWVEAKDIDVLTGNMFACRGDRWMQTKNNPVNDPASSTYACGSSTTNASLLATLVVGVCVAVGWAMVRRGQGGSMVSELLGQWQHATQRAKEHMWVMGMVAGVFAACMIVYAVVTETSSAYAETYIWVVSLSLQQGQWAGAVLVVWLCFVHGAFVYGSQNVRSKLLEKEAGYEGRPSMAAQALAATQRSVRPSVVVCVVLALVCVQIVPGLAVNVLYVIATTQQLSQTAMVFIAASMALFKLTWSSGINALLLRGKLLRGWMGVSFLHTEWLFRALVYTGVFNLIVSPLVTEMLISPNCFQYVFSRIPTSSYSVEGGTCYWITYSNTDPVTKLTLEMLTTLACMSYDELEATYNSGSAQSGNHQMNVISMATNGEASTIDFQAGFVYNYQCMFSLLEAFAFVFVYRYVFSLLVLPTIRWVMKRAQTAAFVRGGTSSRWFQLWSRSLPTLQQMIDDERVCFGEETEDTTRRREWMRSNTALLHRFVLEEEALIMAKMTAMRVIFDVAVAMSFGVLFPLVGMMAVASAVKDVWTMRWTMQKLCRHRDLCVSTLLSPIVSDDSTVHEYVSSVETLVDTLEATLEAQIPRIVREVPRVMCIAVVLWAFALYDVVGREAGAIDSAWVAIVVGLLPWWWWVVQWAWRWKVRKWTVHARHQLGWLSDYDKEAALTRSLIPSDLDEEDVVKEYAL